MSEADEAVAERAIVSDVRRDAAEPNAATTRIRGIRLRECSFSLVPEFDADGRELPVEFRFDIARSYADNRHLTVVLGVSLFQGVEEAPFRARVAYEAAFEVEGENDERGLQAYGRYNAFATLVPYLRETLSSLTSRAGFLPLLLPPINVQEMVDALDESSSGDT